MELDKYLIAAALKKYDRIPDLNKYFKTVYETIETGLHSTVYKINDDSQLRILNTKNHPAIITYNKKHSAYCVNTEKTFKLS